MKEFSNNSGNPPTPPTFGINPLGDHRRRHVSDDSGYEGADNEADQNNGSPIKVNNPNVTDQLEDQDQLLDVIIGPSSPNQPSALSDSEELVPIPTVTPLIPGVNPESQRQTRTWIFRGKIFVNILFGKIRIHLNIIMMVVKKL